MLLVSENDYSIPRGPMLWRHAAVGFVSFVLLGIGIGLLSIAHLRGADIEPPVMNVCDLFENLRAYEGRLVAVAGELQSSRELAVIVGKGCRHSFSTHGDKWPTVLTLLPSDERQKLGQAVPFETDLAAVDSALRISRNLIESDNKVDAGARVVAVVVGKIIMKQSYEALDHTLPPRPIRDGFGWLGLSPAGIVAKTIRDVKIIRFEPALVK